MSVLFSSSLRPGLLVVERTGRRFTNEYWTKFYICKQGMVKQDISPAFDDGAKRLAA